MHCEAVHRTLNWASSSTRKVLQMSLHSHPGCSNIGEAFTGVF